MAEQVLKSLNLSSEEMSRLTHSMKDPKFRELLDEYMQEISEPRNREEADSYIRMVEERQKFSMEGKELIVPDAGFCVKTKNRRTGRKVFINVCRSSNIEKPTSVCRPGSGEEWSIPFSLGPTRTDYDKARTECDVHDFVVNDEAHERAAKSMRFKRFLADTAIENIQKQRGVELEQNFVLPKLTYKGSSKNPKMQTVRRRESATESSSTPTVPASTKTPAEHEKLKVEPVKEEVEPEPRYEFIYRDDLDMSRFWEHQPVVESVAQKPKAVVLRVSLPDVVTASEVQLDVSGTEVSLHVPGKYKLKANTRYPVDFQNGRAEFDKSKRKLEIVMPTC